MRRTLLTACALAAILALHSGPAAACGGLVAPNGAIRLQRATTLVDWHAGVEHYMTSFAFRGDATNLGWIVPLPAVPTKIEEGGGWTLQRLEREVHPRPVGANFAAHSEAAAAPAEVLQQVRVQALDVTVIRGSGTAITQWCALNGFVLPDETRDHLLHYAAASPIFMAAKYDVSAARARGLLGGDGTPLLITMPTPRAWVPLEILANDDGPVGADLFMLSDERLVTGEESFFSPSPVGRELTGAPGFTVRSQERLGEQLHRDLSSDRNMGWVRPQSWLTYLTLDASSPTVTYDLSVGAGGNILLAGFGSPRSQPGAPQGSAPRFTDGTVGTISAAAVVLGTLLLSTVVSLRRRRRSAPAS